VKQVDTVFFDGKSARKRHVTVSLEHGIIRVSGDGVDFSCPVAEVRLSDGVGSVCHTIRFSDGGICEITDADMIAVLEGVCGRSAHGRWIHRWERSAVLVLTGLAGLLLALFIFMRFGVPLMAEKVAFAIPENVERRLGSDALVTLDRLVFKPSSLDDGKREQIAALFRRVAGNAVYRIEFRNSQALGANAIALPSGIVVVTDGLVELAANDKEIASVLAHEIGHVERRHGLRHVLQNTVTVLVMSALTGDLVSVTSLSAALPTALIDASFSRQFEREADDAAITWMKANGVEPVHYANILAKLQAQIDVKTGGANAGKKARNYLSTHPDTGERIRRIMGIE